MGRKSNKKPKRNEIHSICSIVIQLRESLNLRKLSQLQPHVYIEQISIFPEKVLTLHEAKNYMQ